MPKYAYMPGIRFQILGFRGERERWAHTAASGRSGCSVYLDGDLNKDRRQSPKLLRYTCESGNEYEQREWLFQKVPPGAPHSECLTDQPPWVGAKDASAEAFFVPGDRLGVPR